MQNETRSDHANAPQAATLGLAKNLLSKLQALVSRVDSGLLVILAVPWLILAAKVAWVFSGVGAKLIDSWVYFGFFLDLGGHFKNFPPTYYASRLTWVLPGYVVYKVFPAVMAAYILHLAFYYAAVISHYWILKQTVGQRAALISTVFMGCYAYFLQAMGWNCVDGAGIVYFLLTTLALTCAAAHRGGRLWLIVAGALYGAMVYSQLFLVVFTLPLAVYYLFVNRRRRPLAISVLFFASGFVLISFVLSAINHRLNGDFRFYAPSLRIAASMLRANPDWSPLHAWVNGANWLVLPAAAFLGSIAFLFLAKNPRSDARASFARFFQFYFLLCAAIFVVLQLSGQFPLQYPEYASYLAPVMFLAIGAQLAPGLERLSSRHFALLVSGTIGVFVFSYALGSYLGSQRELAISGLSLAAAVLLAITSLVLLRRHSLQAFALFVLWLSLGLVNFTNGSYRHRQSAWRDPVMTKQIYLAVVQSVRGLKSADPTQSLLFWYNLNEPQGVLYRSLASTYLWGYRLTNERFPSLEKATDSYQPPKLFDRIAILSTQKDAFQKADEALKSIGFRARFLEERSYQQGPLAWRMTSVQVRNEALQNALRLSRDGWPESLRLPWGPQKGRVLSFVGPEARQIFRSDMDTVDGWTFFPHRRSGSFYIESKGVTSGDSLGVFSSDDPRDHIASPFDSAPTSGPGLLFFSMWVKALEDHRFPTVSIRDGQFSVVAHGRELSERPDGWVLVGGWLELREPQKFHFIIEQPPRTISVLDKALLIEFPNPPPAQ